LLRVYQHYARHLRLHRVDEHRPETACFHRYFHWFNPTTKVALQARGVVGQLPLPEKLPACIKRYQATKSPVKIHSDIHHAMPPDG
jgi:hypothetical protein